MKTLLPIILIALAVGTYFVYISPELVAVKVLRAEETKYIEAMEKSVELARVYGLVATDYNSLTQEDIDRLNVFLPNAIDPTALAQDLDGVAARYGIKLKSVEVANTDASTSSTEPSGKPFITYTVSLKFKAPYPNFSQFMKDIERSLMILDTTRVVFTTTETNIYDFDIVLQAYALNTK